MLKRISGLLGWVLGIAACSDEPMYGMPHAVFDLDGRVVQAGTETVIPGVEVNFFGNIDTTDANGTWSFSEVGAVACGLDCWIIARDIDGTDNGEYQETRTEFSATQTAEGDGTWDNGSWAATDITIEMTEETNDPRH